MAVCIAYPTIMSGLVLRWFADEAGYSDGLELANAGREEACTFDGCGVEIAGAAQSAHELIKAAHARNDRRPDVSRWVTHEQTTLFGRSIRPIVVAGDGE